MIKGQNIICFGSSSWQYPGLQQKIMRLLSVQNKILYVNAIGSRSVSLDFFQIRFYYERILRQFQKYHHSGNILVCNPMIIPLMYSNLISKINRKILYIQFSKILSRINFSSYILWVGTPTAAFCLDIFDPALIVYNPVDRYYAFPFVNSKKIKLYEEQIAKKANAIIGTSEAIRNDLLVFNKHTFTVTHGVDVDHFRSALEVENVPEDIKSIPKPIIGYFGGLSDRVNFSLIRQVAVRYPYASVVLLGNKLTDLSDVENLKNVYVLGYKKFNELPFYLKEFNVCLIPYHVNELMEAVDPIKLREYLCLGKPVVSVNLPEVQKLRGLVYIGKDEDDFVKKVGNALEENNTSLIDNRVQAARQSEWPVKIKMVSEIIKEAFSRKHEISSNRLEPVN